MSVSMCYNYNNHSRARIMEINGNIFSAPSEYSLADAVSGDLFMRTGLCKEFDKRYKMKQNLFNVTKLDIGSVRILKRNDTSFVFYVVTKEKCYYNLKNSSRKQFIKDFEKGLEGLRDACTRLKIKKLAIPKMGCGIGGFSWQFMMEPLIQKVFKFTEIDILVFNYNAAVSSTEVNKSLDPVYPRTIKCNDILLMQQLPRFHDSFSYFPVQNISQLEPTPDLDTLLNIPVSDIVPTNSDQERADTPFLGLDNIPGLLSAVEITPVTPDVLAAEEEITTVSKLTVAQITEEILKEISAGEQIFSDEQLTTNANIVPFIHSDMNQIIPYQHSDINQIIPYQHSDMNQIIPYQHSDMNQIIPDQHSDMNQIIPDQHSDTIVYNELSDMSIYDEYPAIGTPDTLLSIDEIEELDMDEPLHYMTRIGNTFGAFSL